MLFSSDNFPDNTVVLVEVVDELVELIDLSRQQKFPTHV